MSAFTRTLTLSGWWLALGAVFGAGACGGGGTNSAGGSGGPGTDAATSGTVPDAGGDATTESGQGGTCMTDSDCASQVPPTSPIGCATGKCNVSGGYCVFFALDEDKDTHPAANCLSTNGIAIQDGDDCNDQDPNIYPGHPEQCSATLDGGTIVWPTGSPTGICMYGERSCLADHTESACTGAVGPGARDCTSPNDNDCDGKPDNTECGACVSGQQQTCYTGPSATEGVGICKSGTETCALIDAGETSWSPCDGQTLPAPRNCSSTSDNDCDGKADDQECGPCEVGASPQPCYTGPAGTEGVGICHGGDQSCVLADGGTYWGTCTGQATPGARNCASSVDNDCDGKADDQECGVCEVGPGAPQTQSCYPGPAGTLVGNCKAGSQTCVLNSNNTTGWGACAGYVLPGPLNCASSSDNNCDGQADDSEAACYCGSLAPNASQACTEANMCGSGTQVCSPSGPSSSLTACTGPTAPGLQEYSPSPSSFSFTDKTAQDSLVATIPAPPIFGTTPGWEISFTLAQSGNVDNTHSSTDPAGPAAKIICATSGTTMALGSSDFSSGQIYPFTCPLNENVEIYKWTNWGGGCCGGYTRTLTIEHAAYNGCP